MSEEPRVTVQGSQRYPGRAMRFAYVLHVPGYWAMVSAYRYGSEAKAMAAGQADLEGFLEAIKESRKPS